MKKTISKIICIFMMLCVFLIGCNQREEMSEFLDSSNELNNGQGTNSQVVNTASILEKSSRNSYKELLQTAYHQEDLIENLTYFGTDNFNTMLDELNKKYPIECIREFDNSLPYCVYKLQEGGLLYAYFHGDSLKFLDYVFVVKDALTKDDFSKLKPGDSLSKVESIDKGTQLINSINSDYLYAKTTYHLVKEGFMEIKYQKEGQDDRPENYRVQSVRFIPNGGQITSYGAEEPVLQTYRFLDEDYPQ